MRKFIETTKNGSLIEKDLEKFGDFISLLLSSARNLYGQGIG
jgi:hypothetical protein